MRIAAERVSKSYGRPVLRDCSITVETGECALLHGPSGGGKSTLLRILALLESADEGTILHDDRRLTPDDARNAEPFPFLTLVFQQLFLWPHLTIAQNLSLVLSGSTDGRVSDEGSALLARLDVEGLFARLPHECSLGQRQRIAIARALLTPARFLLLDEPSSALDTTNQQKVIAELGAAKESGRGLLIVTHNERAFDSLADQRLLLEDGRLRSRIT